MSTETTKHKSQAGTLLAAVSVIAMSVGMVPAVAADDQSQGILVGMSKLEKHKPPESSQIKGESTQQKGDAIHIKMNSRGFNPQPEPPGDKSSVQIKMHSQHIKMESSQKKHDSDASAGHGQSNEIVSPRDSASGLPTGR